MTTYFPFLTNLPFNYRHHHEFLKLELFTLNLQEGKALKLLATAARLDIEDFLQKKVYLEVLHDEIYQVCVHVMRKYIRKFVYVDGAG